MCSEYVYYMLLVCSGPRVLSLVGDIYCCSASEMVEFSVSACKATVGCSVPLKEGMRPAPVVVEETEVAEIKDEKHAEKVTEVAAEGEGKVSEEQPVYVLVQFLILQLFGFFICNFFSRVVCPVTIRAILFRLTY